jgi:hypothetical protein
VLREVSGPKKVEASGHLRILHNELRDLYRSTDVLSTVKSERQLWDVHVARLGNIRNAYRFGEDISSKTATWIPRNWEDNIKINPKETCCEDGK